MATSSFEVWATQSVQIQPLPHVFLDVDGGQGAYFQAAASFRGATVPKLADVGSSFSAFGNEGAIPGNDNMGRKCLFDQKFVECEKVERLFEMKAQGFFRAFSDSGHVHEIETPFHRKKQNKNSDHEFFSNLRDSRHLMQDIGYCFFHDNQIS